MRNDKLLPELIKNLCDEKEMSYYNLASASGVPITTIMNIVHGITKNPGIFTILKLLLLKIWMLKAGVQCSSQGSQLQMKTTCLT